MITNTQTVRVIGIEGILLIGILAEIETELRIVAAIAGIVLAVYTVIKIRQEIKAKRLEIQLKEMELKRRQREIDREDNETKSSAA